MRISYVSAECEELWRCIVLLWNIGVITIPVTLWPDEGYREAV